MTTGIYSEISNSKVFVDSTVKRDRVLTVQCFKDDRNQSYSFEGQVLFIQMDRTTLRIFAGSTRGYIEYVVATIDFKEQKLKLFLVKIQFEEFDKNSDKNVEC